MCRPADGGRQHWIWTYLHADQRPALVKFIRVLDGISTEPMFSFASGVFIALFVLDGLIASTATRILARLQYLYATVNLL